MSRPKEHIESEIANHVKEQKFHAEQRSIHDKESRKHGKRVAECQHELIEYFQTQTQPSPNSKKDK